MYHPQEVLRHELAHYLFHQRIPNLPSWLDEGMAEFYSTFEVRNHQLIIGAPPSRLRNRGGLTRPGPQQLLAWTAGLGKTTSLEAGSMYLGAWMMVHLMHEVYGARLQTLLSELANGAAWRDAWEHTFWPVQEELEHKYVAQQRALFWRKPYRLPGDGVFGVERERTLEDAEVHLLWASISHEPDQFFEHVREAETHGGDAAEMHFARGRFHLAKGDVVAAERELSTALQSRPTEYRYQLGLMRLHLFEAEQAPDRAQALSEMEPEVRRLAGHASAARDLNFIAWYYSKRSNTDIGLPFAMRAVQANPTCPKCFDTLASLLFLKGSVDEAIRFEERALNLLPHGANEPEMAARLTTFQRRRGATP